MTAAAQPTHDAPIILYDGVCNLCNALVRFVLKHERSPIARFASQQSSVGRELLQQHALPTDDMQTVVLITGAHAYTRSDAAWRIARLLRPPWSWGVAIRFLPKPIRECLYRLIATNRYKLFGRQTACPVPSPAHRDRFLDLDDNPASRSP